jgi:hypothetical protein
MKTTTVWPEVHSDHITSFLPLPHLHPSQFLTTSGDSHLSILDLRKSSPVSVSEDQEDDLLSSCLADSRICVGTQLGVITLWKSGEWLDHVDRIAPAQKVKRGDEASSVDCLVRVGEGVVAAGSDGVIRRVGFRPNGYKGEVGRCEEGVVALEEVSREEGWVVSASGRKIQFWDLDVQVEDPEDSSEDETPKRKKKKKGKKVRTVSGNADTFFADL